MVCTGLRAGAGRQWEVEGSHSEQLRCITSLSCVTKDCDGEAALSTRAEMEIENECVNPGLDVSPGSSRWAWSHRLSRLQQRNAVTLCLQKESQTAWGPAGISFLQQWALHLLCSRHCWLIDFYAVRAERKQSQEPEAGSGVLIFSWGSSPASQAGPASEPPLWPWERCGWEEPVPQWQCLKSLASN